MYVCIGNNKIITFIENYSNFPFVDVDPEKIYIRKFIRSFSNFFPRFILTLIIILKVFQLLFFSFTIVNNIKKLIEKFMSKRDNSAIHLIKRYISTTNFPRLSISNNVTRDIEQPNKRRKKKMKEERREKNCPIFNSSQIIIIIKFFRVHITWRCMKSID